MNYVTFQCDQLRTRPEPAQQQLHVTNLKISVKSNKLGYYTIAHVDLCCNCRHEIKSCEVSYGKIDSVMQNIYLFKVWSLTHHDILHCDFISQKLCKIFEPVASL